MTPEQLSMEPSVEVSPVRVELLAGVIAGFRWPGRESFSKLRKPQQKLALDVARQALERLAREGAD